MRFCFLFFSSSNILIRLPVILQERQGEREGEGEENVVTIFGKDVTNEWEKKIRVGIKN